MINASQEFKKLINSGVKVVNYADITLRDGTVLNLTPEDFVLGGFSMSDEMTDGKFGVGFAIGKTIDVTIANHTNKFSNYDFYNSIIYMYVAIHTEDGRVLKERKGKYYVINPTSPGEVIKLSGVDSMHLLDKPYNAKTAYPATLQTILSDCCIDCGINIGFRQFDKYNFVVSNKPEDATYRDVVSYVAQIAGYNARISNNDALELIWYDTAFMGIDVLDGGKLYSYAENDTYDGGDFSNYEETILFDGGNFTDASPENVTKVKSLSVSTDEIIITGIVVENENTRKSKGAEDYVIKVKDNPLTIGKEDEILSYLYNKLVGYKFRALDCKIVNNPLFEPFDACYVYDRKGNFYFTLINSVKYKIGGFTTISCKADDPIRNESSYTSEAAKAEVRAKRKASELALKAYEDAKKHSDNQLTIYDYSVQNMNMLAANAMGLYRESEKQSDGSEIYYQSNRPIIKNDAGKCQFETDSVVYKMTGNGFFVSSDGGLSFTSGFDSNGNAIVNVLSAIGITFDWARGGELALGGDGNVNGKLIVYDGQGNQVGKWDKDGITLPPGTKIEWSQVSGTEDVAKKNEIPKKISQLSNDSGFTTSIDVNSIITGTVTASFINALKIKAGSVDAENITGTTIEGKQLKGGSISIGNNFSVDSNGNVIANSLKSNNATITGGSINITTSSDKYSVITLNSSTFVSKLSPGGLRVESGLDYTTISAGMIYMKNGDIVTDSINLNTIYDNTNSGISVMSPIEFNYNTIFEIGHTHTFRGTVEMSGNVDISGLGSTLKTWGNSIISGSGKMLGFFGDVGGVKRSVTTIASTSGASTSDCASKINEVINALKAYNLL